MRKQFPTLPMSLFLLLLQIIVPGIVRAQESGLQVTITRPGEGELLYASPTSPFASAQITGLVAVDDFNVSQIQVRLDILQGTKSVASLTSTPKSDGTFSFDVAINPERPATKSSGEYSCKGDCHAITNVGLPAGPVLLRVTAADPLGRKATAERSIISEHSGYADVPVRVIVDGDAGRSMEGLHILADTRLLTWRARQYSGSTDSEGRSIIHLEALGQVPTRYAFQIEPMIMGGVLYQSKEPVQVVIPAGATKTDPVTLVAVAQRGQIEGRLDPKGFQNLSSLTIRATDLASGASYTSPVAEGRFTLTGLALSHYVLTVDNTEATLQRIDLTSRPVTTATLTLATASSRTVRGGVRDQHGSPLPLAWVAGEDKKVTGRVSPTSGEFALPGIADDIRSLWVVSPGYYARPVASGLGNVQVALIPLPETRITPWGTGTITLPPQSIATLSGHSLALKRGWVWGVGTGPFSITTPDLDIAFEGGSFALEYMPGENSWLYVLQNQAQVIDTLGVRVTVDAGQMLFFGNGAVHPSPVVLEYKAFQALHAGETSPVALDTDPTLLARIRDEIERLGIPFPIAVVAALAMLGCGTGMALLRRRIGLGIRNPKSEI